MTATIHTFPRRGRSGRFFDTAIFACGVGCCEDRRIHGPRMCDDCQRNAGNGDPDDWLRMMAELSAQIYRHRHPTV